MAQWDLSVLILVPILFVISASAAHDVNGTDGMSARIEAKGKDIDALSSSIENSTNRMEDDISAAGKSIDSKVSVQRVEDEGQLVELFSEIMDQITERKGKEVENLVENKVLTGSKHEDISHNEDQNTTNHISGDDPVEQKAKQMEGMMEQKEKDVENKGKLVEEIGHAIEKAKRQTIPNLQITSIKTPDIHSNFQIKFKNVDDKGNQTMSGNLNQKTSKEIQSGLQLHNRSPPVPTNNTLRRSLVRPHVDVSWFSRKTKKYHYRKQKSKLANAERKSVITELQGTSMEKALHDNVKTSWRAATGMSSHVANRNVSIEDGNITANTSNNNVTLTEQKESLLNGTAKTKVIVPMDRERLGKLLLYSYMSGKLKKGEFNSMEDAFRNGTTSSIGNITSKELEKIIGDNENKTRVITPTSRNGTNITNFDIEQLLGYIKTLNNSISENNEENKNDSIIVMTSGTRKPSTSLRHFNRFLVHNETNPKNDPQNDSVVASPTLVNTTSTPLRSPVNEVISDLGKEVSDITGKLRGRVSGASACNTTECVARELIRRLGQKFLKATAKPKANPVPVTASYLPFDEIKPPPFRHHEDFKETERYVEDDGDHHKEHLHQAHDFDHADTYHHEVHDVFIDDPQTNHVHVAVPHAFQLEPEREPHPGSGQTVHHVHHHYHHNAPGVDWVHPFHPLPHEESGQEPKDEGELEVDDADEHRGEESEGRGHQEFIEPDYLRHEASQLPGVISADQLPPLIPPAEHLGNMLADIEHQMSSNFVMPPVNEAEQMEHAAINSKFDDISLKRDDDPTSLINSLQGVPYDQISVPDNSPTGVIAMKSDNQDIPGELGGAFIPDPSNLHVEGALQDNAIKKTLPSKPKVGNKTLLIKPESQNSSHVNETQSKEFHPQDNMDFLKRTQIQPFVKLARTKHSIDSSALNNVPRNGLGVSYLSYLTEKYGHQLESNLRKGSMDVEAVGRDIERKVRKGVRRVTKVSYDVEGPDYDRHGRFYHNIHPEDVEDDVDLAMQRWESERNQRPLGYGDNNRDYGWYGDHHHRKHHHHHHHHRHHKKHHGLYRRRLHPLILGYQDPKRDLMDYDIDDGEYDDSYDY